LSQLRDINRGVGNSEQRLREINWAIRDLQRDMNENAEEALREKRSIGQLLLDLIDLILKLPSDIATLLRDNLFPAAEIPELPDVPDVDFDFRINLMDYFPFSLPRDLHDIISIMLGSMPTELAGATTNERAVFFHYQEVGYLSDEGHAFIAPLTANTGSPRFEMKIPIPSFSSGGIGAGSEETAYTFVLDLNEYPTLIAVINWGVFLVFLVGLIKITPSVLTW
jgi:hypothetical protein